MVLMLKTFNSYTQHDDINTLQCIQHKQTECKIYILMCPRDRIRTHVHKKTRLKENKLIIYILFVSISVFIHINISFKDENVPKNHICRT